MGRDLEKMWTMAVTLASATLSARHPLMLTILIEDKGKTWLHETWMCHTVLFPLTCVLLQCFFLLCRAFPDPSLPKTGRDAIWGLQISLCLPSNRTSCEILGSLQQSTMLFLDVSQLLTQYLTCSRYPMNNHAKIKWINGSIIHPVNFRPPCPKPPSPV